MKRTIAIVLSLLAVGGLTWWLVRKTPPAEKPVVHKQERYLPPPPVEAARSPVTFALVAEEAGLNFRHETGAFQFDDGGSSRYLPECMGPGAILFDADGDGKDDLFVPNGTTFPGRGISSSKAHFFHNQGGLRFRECGAEVGLDLAAYGMGGAAADVDGDSDQDLVVTTWGGVRFFLNERDLGTMRFTEQTLERGLATAGWTDARGRTGPDWSTAAVFADTDQDGDLDLMVANYAKWSPEVDVFATLDGKTKSYTIPDQYEGSTCRLFENDGQGRFAEITEKVGMLSTKAKALGIAVADIDGNGFPDFVVANDKEPNFLYLNDGGKFQEAAIRYGIAYDENARTRAGMGIDIADYRGDGRLGIPIGNFSGEPVALYRQESPALFRDVTTEARIAGATQLSLTFGCLFVDVDLDGHLDLLLANGHLEPEIQKVQKEVPYRQRPQLLLNRRDGTFEDVTGTAGPGFASPLVGRALATSDLDQDGDADLVLTDNGGGLRLLRNDGPTRGRGLRIRLKGVGKNRDALGASARLTIGAETQSRFVRTGSSYLSQSSLEILFAIPPDTTEAKLALIWPDGRKEERTLKEADLRASPLVIVREGG